jgi:hypothetical protein
LPTALVVSDKALPFPKSVCRFRQAHVVSDKRFVGKLQAPKLDETRDGMPHVCPGYSLRYDQKIGLQAHKKGQFTLFHQQTVILNEFYCVCVILGHGHTDKGFLRDKLLVLFYPNCKCHAAPQ